MCSKKRIWSISVKKPGLTVGPGCRLTTTSSSVSSARPASRVWLAHITEHRTDEGKLHLCAIKDVLKPDCGLLDRPTNEVAACSGRPGSRGGPTHTSRDDRSFRSRQPAQVREDYPCAVVQRVTRVDDRVGVCGDNAAMASFWPSATQRNVLDRRRSFIRAESRPAIGTWIERTYHRRCRQRALSTNLPR